jgi:2',3'-cyclic-nucleotide 2'-phosphodiesterase (5'-nucleotidase family)
MNLLKKILCAALLLAALSAGAWPQAEIQPVAGQAPTFEERLGADEGAALAILFGANMRGNLDLCDCNHPRGGLARRVGYVEGFKKRFKDTPVVQVEVGQFWYNSEVASPVVLAQNDYVSRAYSRWGVEVINVSRYDLLFARRLFQKAGLNERIQALPMMKNVISANGKFSEDEAAPPPFMVKEVKGPRIKGKKSSIRLGFLGLAEPLPPNSGMMDITVKNMFATARQFVPQLRKQCDVLIILAHCEMAAALQLAKENPEADILIAGNAEGLFKLKEVGKTLVLSAAPGNTQEGDLRLFLSPEGRITFKFLSTDLDAVVPSDPAALAFADEARDALFKLRTR